MEMGDYEDIQNQNTVVWYVAHLHHHVEIDRLSRGLLLMIMNFTRQVLFYSSFELCIQ